MHINKTFTTISFLILSIQLAQAANVSITGSSFQPQVINIVPGTTVTWTNLDPIDHTATSTTGIFDSGIMPPGAQFSFTFNGAGDFEYICTIHGFTGRVVVSSPTLASITLTPGTITLLTGSTQTFTATGFDQNGNIIAISQPINWSVSDPAVGTIIPITGTTGLFTAIANGTTSVNAIVQGITGNATVAVVTTALPLNITASRTKITTGLAANVTFIVTGNGTAVGGATVSLSGSATGTGTTGADGIVTMTVLATGNQTVIARASKAGYLDGTMVLVAKGDVNGDGIVNIVDALFISQYTVGLRGINLTIGDVNGDGQVTIVDALFIAQYTVGLRADPTGTTNINQNAIPPEVIQFAMDWPLPNHDYNNTRASMDSSINSSNVNSLAVAWSFNISGKGVFGGAFSNPLIMGNTVYFQDAKANVFALDLQSGAIKWKNEYNSSSVVGPNGPAEGWGKVFVAKDLYNMAALDAASGKELWTTKLSNVTTTGIDIQPAVYNGMVFASTVPGTGDIFYAPGGVGVIYALDQDTGIITWNFSTVPDDLWGHKEINSGGGCWYTPSVDLETGIMYWGVANPAPFPGTKEWPNGTSRPGDNLYTDSLLALGSVDGKLVWYTQVNPHDNYDHDFQIPPILARTNINGTQQDIVIGAGKKGKVYAFNRNTGSILWVANVGIHQNDNLTAFPQGTTRVYPGPLGGIETPMAYADGIVYAPNVDLFADFTPSEINFSTFNISAGRGGLTAIQVDTGQILWNKQFDSINVGAATVVNDLVFTATYDGTIYALKRASGEQAWKFKAPAGINAWPAVAGDTIIWPAGVGNTPLLIAFKPPI